MRFKVCRYCKTIYKLSTEYCSTPSCWIGFHKFCESDFDIVDINPNDIKISQLHMGEQEFQKKTEKDYMNRDGMSPRERWLQRFKK